MSSTNYQRQQGTQDANNGKGAAGPNSFKTHEERNAYNTAYQAEQERLRQQNKR